MHIQHGVETFFWQIPQIVFTSTNPSSSSETFGAGSPTATSTPEFVASAAAGDSFEDFPESGSLCDSRSQSLLGNEAVD
jgi:hypothetical protein